MIQFYNLSGTVLQGQEIANACIGVPHFFKNIKVNRILFVRGNANEKSYFSPSVACTQNLYEYLQNHFLRAIIKNMGFHLFTYK